MGETALERPYGTPTAGQLEKINALAKRPLKAEDVFVFADKAVGDGLIPERFMRVHKTLLEVFREDARRGVSLMLDHSWAADGLFGLGGRPKPAYAYGRTFDAVLRKTLDNSLTDETWALFVDHYIVRGREKDGIKTDQIIADIEDGVAFDTSIGFGNDKYICSICGEDYMDYSKCKHFRGQEYDGEICHIILKPPGFLMENSIVFDGAYPGAGILSAMGAIGKIENYLDPVEDLKGFKEGTRFVHTFSNTRGRINTFALRDPVKGIVVPDTQGLSVAGAAKPAPGKEGETKTMFENELVAAILNKAGIDTNQVEGMEVDKLLPMVTEKLTEQAVAEAKAEAQAAAQTANQEPQFALTEADVRGALGLATGDIPDNWASEIVRFAKEGRDARQELINDTLEWGVRAYGNDFASESYREMLSEPGRSVQAIKDLREQFKRVAQQSLNPGRVTNPTNPQGEEENHVPPEAFKVSGK